MSPEIRINKELIADVPDETGYYKTLEGNPLYISVDGIDPDNEVQRIIVQTRRTAGKPGSYTADGTRVIELSPAGIGSQQINSSGDMLHVTLTHKPIREIIYTRRERDSRSLADRRGSVTVWEGRSRSNPRWMRGHGQR